jgi:hypothetical protein
MRQDKKGEAMDIVGKLRVLTEQLEYSVSRFQGKTCITEEDLKVLREALRRLGEEG